MKQISKLLVLTNVRIMLRQLTIEDKNEIFELRTNADVNKYLERAPCKSIMDAQIFINTVNENILLGKSLYWAITVLPTKTVVGTICLFDFSTEKYTCEIGYELLVKHQGKGIMKEAIQLVIDYALHTLNIKKIFAVSHFKNQKSTKLLQQVGFTRYNSNQTEKSDLDFFVLEP